LRRASVVVRQFGDNGANFFVKGAPESIRDICVPESLPSDYDDLLNHYTHKGYRVIACATKYERKLSWMKVQKLSRADAESNLEFVGFIIFENKLKPTTSQVISELNQAGIRNVMCTGDNILTAISVARECKMIGRDEQCFIPHFIESEIQTSISSCSVLIGIKVMALLASRLSFGNVLTTLMLGWILEPFWYDHILPFRHVISLTRCTALGNFQLKRCFGPRERPSRT